jgi:hypothetical protein
MSLSSLKLSAYRLNQSHSDKIVDLPRTQLNIRDNCRESMMFFVKTFYSQIEPDEFINNWHIEAICDHLEATIHERNPVHQVSELIINLPPRCMKSLLVCVFFPAWVWTNHPEKSFFFGSSTEGLAKLHSEKCRNLINSPMYKTLFPEVELKQSTMLYFENNKLGFRIAKSLSSSIMGLGSSFLIVDDLNEPRESDSQRKKVISWYLSKFQSRAKNEKTVVKIILQQRTHHQDLSGTLLSHENPRLVHLKLPIEYDVDYPCETIPLKNTNGKKWRDPRTKNGELLWPDHLPKLIVDRIKKRMNIYDFAGQYLQRPTPTEGGLIQVDWFKKYNKEFIPNLSKVILSVDTAYKVSETACYTAVTVWGVFENFVTKQSNIILLNLFAEKLEYPEIRKMLKRLCHNYNDVRIGLPDYNHNPPNLVIIEDAASGQALIPDLRRGVNIPIVPFKPHAKGSKEQRLNFVTPFIEGGFVWLPYKANTDIPRDFSKRFLNACVNYPLDSSADIVDTTSQVLMYLQQKKWLLLDEDTEVETAPAKVKNYF